ncbi:uncharacterized protein L199_003658 [Kwoniella botswanensis]|uniref:uncharacterized protein n=1 Tax=Kwoniella botswanensis TaxID=1268659 RepID=UPI00315C8D9D
MPFPYLSFQTFILMMVIPIVILKDIQWRYQQLKSHIKRLTNSIVYDFIPTVGVYTLIGCLAVPAIMFMVLFKLSSYIVRTLCSVFLFLSKSSTISLEEKEADGREEEYEFQEKSTSTSPLISTINDSTVSTSSASSDNSSSGPGTPTTPINTASIESWSYGVYLKRYPSLTVDSRLEFDSEQFEDDDDDRLEYVKEPQPKFERGGDYPYLPLRLNVDDNISPTSTSSYFIAIDTDTSCDNTPITIHSDDPTIATRTREDEKQKEENKRIDNRLLRAKEMNLRHSKFVRRCEKESEKFNASFPGEMDIVKIRKSLELNGKKHENSGAKMDLSVIYE